ncbi:MAG: molybdate ABC transporter substrate-binding protein [Nitrospirae bacterium]|nr:molybdate ABC transporter substrate-binding protein [Nitrospirota bacterium]
MKRPDLLKLFMIERFNIYLKRCRIKSFHSPGLLLLTLSLIVVGRFPDLLYAQDRHDNGELIIAAASDLNLTMPDIVKGFKDSGHEVEVKVIFGSSGNLASQIINGAPFDIILSASPNYIEQMDSAGVVIPDSKSFFAIGRIVLWVPKASRIDIDVSGIKGLLDPSVKKIAIANPQHAPYGRAAVEAMKQLGVYERVKDRLILGENISQTAQFIQSGAADIGIIALSIALSPKMNAIGRFWLIPEGSYNRIEQWAAIINRSNNVRLAEVFIGYLGGKEGRRILSEYGFLVPNDKRER